MPNNEFDDIDDWDNDDWSDTDEDYEDDDDEVVEDWDEDSDFDDDEDQEHETSSKSPVTIILVCAILIAIVGGYFFFFSGSDEETDTTASTSTTRSSSASSSSLSTSSRSSSSASATNPSQTAKTEIPGGSKSAQGAVDEFLQAFYVKKNPESVAEVFDPKNNVTPDGVKPEIDTFNGTDVNVSSIKNSPTNFNTTVDYKMNGKSFTIKQNIDVVKLENGKWYISKINKA